MPILWEGVYNKKRILKFRVWNERAKEMYIPDHLANDIDMEKYQIMQFTGLLDRQGVEIYEGDIVVNEHDINMEVFYHCSENRAEWAGRVATLPSGSYILGWFEANLSEVIGNLWENPELLESK